MSGSIRAHGRGAWRLTVDAPKGTGKRRQITRIYRGTKRDAQTALAALVLEAQAMPAATGDTVASMLRTWLELADLTPASRATSKNYIDTYLVPRLGGIEVARLTPLAIDRAYRELSARGGRGGKPLSPATVRRAHGILTRACGQAVKWGLFASNPARDASPPGSVRPQHRAPSTDDVRAVIEAARAVDVQMATYLALAAATGARRGELCGLRWDTDVEGDTLWIRRSVSVVGATVHIKSTKTGRERPVGIGPATQALIEAHRQYVIGQGRKPTGYMFESPDGGPWLPSTVTHRLVKLRKQVGVNFRLHDLRHYAASTAIDAGIPVTAVSARLGHARTSTTVDMYGSPSTAEDRRAAELLDRILNDVDPVPPSP